jgi:hypothetical protein
MAYFALFSVNFLPARNSENSAGPAITEKLSLADFIE